jgi:hypothetical protein
LSGGGIEMSGYNAVADSDGVMHYIYAQDEPMSCALACMFMMENEIEQMTHAEGEERIKAISGDHPGSLLASQLAGDNEGIGIGTTISNVDKTFVDLGVRLTTYDAFDPTSATYRFRWQKPRISDGHPALILIGWYTYNRGTRTRNGGHYIVAARITRRNAVVVLDSLHGTLHELQGSRGIYMNHGLFGMMEYVLYSG